MRLNEIKYFIEKLTQLPTISPVAIKLIEVVENENIEVKEIAKLIESDQALSSKVIRIANYSLFNAGHEGKITTVQRATVFLGLNMVRSIALSFIVIDIFGKGQGKTFNPVEFWRHSVACAIACELFARRFSYPQPSEAFIAGLLHDLGKLIFFHWEKNQYEKIVAEALITKVRLLEVEEKHIGMGHTYAAKLLMESWKFPPSLVSSAWLHHQPLSEFGSNWKEQLPFIVKCANNLCHIQRFGESGNPISELDIHQLSRITGLPIDDITQLSAGVLNRYEEVSKHYDWYCRPPDLYLSAISRANEEILQLQINLRSTNRQLVLQQQLIDLIKGLHEALSQPITSSQALRRIIEMLGNTIPCNQLMGFMHIEGEKIIEGWLKFGPKNDIEHVLLPLEIDSTDRIRHMGLREHITLIKKAASQLIERSENSLRIIKALDNAGLVVLPMEVDGKILGQILVEIAPFNWDEYEKNEFLRYFSQVATLCLDRMCLFEKLDKKVEELIKMARDVEGVKTRFYEAQQLASVGRLAAWAAHEINNPLAAITIKTQLLLGGAAKEEERKAFQLILDQSMRISKIVKDLMGLTRPAAPSIEPTDILLIIERVLTILENNLIVSGVKVRKEFSPDIPLVNVDAKQLEQVFLNLTINAIHAMENGGDLTMRVEVEGERQRLQINFSDTGIGIPPEELPHIFDHFYTSKKGDGNMGLGLAICRSIIESHNGEITVSSQPGHGTTFTILLPL